MTSVFFKRDITCAYDHKYTTQIRYGDGSLLRKMLYHIRSTGLCARGTARMLNRVIEQAVRENRFDILCLAMGFWYGRIGGDLLLVACQAGRRDMANFIMNLDNRSEEPMISVEHLQAACCVGNIDIVDDLVRGNRTSFSIHQVGAEDIFDMWKINPECVRRILLQHTGLKQIAQYAKSINNADFTAFISGQDEYNYSNKW